MKKDNSIVIGTVGSILLLTGLFLTIFQAGKQEPAYAVLIVAGILGIIGIITLAFSMRE